MMPYIEKECRSLLDSSIDYLIDKAKSVGELNYIITRICDGYIQKFAGSEGVDYSACNAIVGVFECAKQEFIRRRLNPYEDKKRKQNGEVFERR
jgi:hypothetical protein